MADTLDAVGFRDDSITGSGSSEERRFLPMAALTTTSDNSIDRKHNRVSSAHQFSMDNFYRQSLSRQDLNMRAAHSLYRAGWMLAEINGVLHNGHIDPESFHIIQQQVTALDRLQRRSQPPSTVHPATADSRPTRVDISKRPTMLVMNRGVEEAVAVLTHHGWNKSQIRDVLQPLSTPLTQPRRPLSKNGWIAEDSWNHYVYRHAFKSTLKHQSSNLRPLCALFMFGGIIFVGVSLMLHML